MTFSVVDETVADVPVLRLAGEVDIAAAAFQARVTSALDRGAPLVVVDLCDVTFFDSAGLKVLDDAQQDALSRGSRLALAGPEGRILRLFEITGLQDRFRIHETAERAATDDDE